jgi:NDP-sugar pyrophosphorylase family protein
MKAMIYAAGLGTRLYPLTQSKPKALIKINNIPLIEILIKRLISLGFHDIIINLHHQADQIEEFIFKNSSFGITIKFSDERDQLLDTGGGLKKASWFFDDSKPFLVHNVDVITNLDIIRMMNWHVMSGALATLAVRLRTSSRYLYFDHENYLCGWENTKKGEKLIVRPSKDIRAFAFSGIQILDPNIFDVMDQEGKFSIIDVYLKLASVYNIKSFDHTDSIWMDVGKQDSLSQADSLLDLINKTQPKN